MIVTEQEKGKSSSYRSCKLNKTTSENVHGEILSIRSISKIIQLPRPTHYQQKMFKTIAEQASNNHQQPPQIAISNDPNIFVTISHNQGPKSYSDRSQLLRKNQPRNATKNTSVQKRLSTKKDSVVSSGVSNQIKSKSLIKTHDNFRDSNMYFPVQSMPKNQEVIFQKAATEHYDRVKNSVTYKQISTKGKWIKVISKYRILNSQADKNIKKLMKIDQLEVKSLNPYLERSQGKILNKTLGQNFGGDFEEVLGGEYLIKNKQEKCKNRPKSTNSHSKVLIPNNNYMLSPIPSQSQLFKKEPTRNQKISSKKKSLSREYLEKFMIRKPNIRKDYFVFGLNKRLTNESKLEQFRDFLWKINFSNSLHVDTPKEISNLYKVFIGYGNNSKLIRTIMRKRFWWSVHTIEDKQKEDKKKNKKNYSQWRDYNFIWTQLKIDKYFDEQISAYKPPEIYREITYLQTNNSVSQQINQSKNINNLQESLYRQIFGEKDMELWKDYYETHKKYEEKITEKTYIKRLTLMQRKDIFCIQSSQKLQVQNHLPANYHIGNKKALFYHLKQYYQLRNLDPFSIIPYTFHINRGTDDPEFAAFKQYFHELELKKNSKTRKQNNQELAYKNIWIMKPGENSNRGTGITVCYTFDDIVSRMKAKQKNLDGSSRTFIIQKYIENPMLYDRRKFDIRHFMLITCINGLFKAYWYQEGYIRTSSSYFTLRYSKDPFVHLTNDAIQKSSDTYGQFQAGNKLSYSEFQKYLEKLQKYKDRNFFDEILPKMKEIAGEVIRSSYRLLDKNRKAHNFQLMGLDFMLDQQLKPWLIQINTNPCLQTACPLLERLIPDLLDNTFKITIDPIYPPPQSWHSSKKVYFGGNPLQQNKFEIIFDDQCQGQELQIIFANQQIPTNIGLLQEDDQQFQQQQQQEKE